MARPAIWWLKKFLSMISAELFQKNLDIFLLWANLVPKANQKYKWVLVLSIMLKILKIEAASCGLMEQWDEIFCTLWLFFQPKQLFLKNLLNWMLWRIVTNHEFLHKNKPIIILHFLFWSSYDTSMNSLKRDEKCLLVAEPVKLVLKISRLACFFCWKNPLRSQDFLLYPILNLTHVIHTKKLKLR